MNEEIWKDIPGYEGKYQVSSLGRVKSLDRYIRCGTGGRGMRRMKGRILRPGPRSDGHMSVVLGHGESGSQVHQLVMLAFIGPCPKGMEVCHNNGNPADNRLENLRYDTRTNNILDKYRQGGAHRKLTVKDGEMTIHISLVSKKIVNLFPGLADDAQKDGAELLQPTTDTVEYSDGTTEEVHGFDVPVPYLDKEFDLALIGEKGVWYDHKVSVSLVEE